VTADSIDSIEKTMPSIDFSEYTESLDNTTSSQELACTAGSCEL
jgi:hypothetical protein